jgi:pimeloyl-ACP methyl ester carboxylesterase
MTLLFFSTFPNPVSFYWTYDPSVPLDLGAEPTEFLDDVAWFVRPSTLKHHVVVMVHGRSGNMAQVAPLARELIAAGHGVFLFDMPRKGIPHMFLRRRHWGAMIDDRDAGVVISYAIHKAFNLAVVNNTAPLVTLYGHSLGGAYALQEAADHCLLDAVISDGAPFSLAHAVLSHAGLSNNHTIDLIPAAAFWPRDKALLPWLYNFFELPYREVWAFTFDNSSRCDTPSRWLGLHSRQDSIVPASHLDQLRRRTAGAWRESNVVVINGSHWDPARPERVAAVLNFLSK